MDIQGHLDDVRTGIRAGRYANEASVSQGIILRLLQALDWPTYNTQVVCPEYSLEGRRVDFALCHPPGKPIAFIEVKQIGQSDGAERQLFEYAFHAGVPLAILTDGQEWNFFLPAEQGDYAERRVYKLDIVERDLAEAVKRLNRYLAYSGVTSGQAISAAREDYRDVSRSRQVRAALPEALAKLVAEGDDLLIELVAVQVESLCGYKPDPDTVARFLRERLAHEGPQPSRVSPPRSTTSARSHGVSASPPSSRSTGTVLAGVGFALDGRFVKCRSGREVLVGVFEALAKRDATFLTRFAARPKHGRTRRYLAQSADELYPGRPDLAREHFAKLSSGWFVGTNLSLTSIARIAEMACEVAGIRYGKDLVVNVGE